MFVFYIKSLMSMARYAMVCLMSQHSDSDAQHMMLMMVRIKMGGPGRGEGESKMLIADESGLIFRILLIQN